MPHSKVPHAFLRFASVYLQPTVHRLLSQETETLDCFQSRLLHLTAHRQEVPRHSPPRRRPSPELNFAKMGKMAEMQRKLLEVSQRSTLSTADYPGHFARADEQQMMGPEAMGLTIVNYNWYDDKVCKNFLFGTCPHIVFSNTVSSIIAWRDPC